MEMLLGQQRQVAALKFEILISNGTHSQKLDNTLAAN
jgi:hypothetical protein